MTDQNEASQAPATAVEATLDANPTGGEAPANPSPETSAPQNPAEVQPHPGAAADAAQAESSTAEAEDSGADSESEAEGSAGESEVEGGGPSDQAGDPNKKKRRRRRRKKHGAVAGQAGAEGVPAGAPGSEGGERPERPAREGAGGVFARFFEGPNSGKRHAFAAGEVIAGRVVRVVEGAFAVDLFGKAVAYVDIFEPREVPHIPEPVAPAPAAPAEVALEGAASTDGDAPATPEAQAESPPDAQPTAEAPSETPPAVEATPAAAEAQPAPELAESAPAAVEADAAEAHDAVARGEEHGDEAAHEEHAELEPEPEPPPPPELGAIFRGRIGSVAESGHIAIVNRIIDVPAVKQKLVLARESRRRVRGVVFGFNRGGFDVLVEGIRVFCPASGMSLGPIDDPHALLGQRLEFTVPPAKAGAHGLVVSRRGILERMQRKAAKQLLKSLQPGQRLKGRVTQVREFGLFVDLGGIEGLVHQSELSFSRGVKPSDAAQIGDEIEVQVLRVGEGQTRKERERVSLSLKALQDDPWGQHADVLEPGTVHTGKVMRTTEFGAFIELAPQIEGLLHISELGRELKHASQAVNEGDELRVVVERVDRKQRRISLSRLSQAEEKALESGVDLKSARPPKLGAHLTVAVDKVDHAGLIVQVPGVFGRRGRGFIPNSEMGTERGTDHRKGFPPGTQIPVKVIGVDRDGGFRFSRKALLVEEERRSVQDYRREAARQGLGTFGDLLRKKLESGKQSG